MNHRLLGQIVKLDITQFSDEHHGSYTSYSVNDPEMVKLLKEQLGEDVRIRTPSSIVTIEYRVNRFNVHLNHDGVIIDITHG